MREQENRKKMVLAVRLLFFWSLILLFTGISFAATWNTTTKSDFDAGTYTQTEYNSTGGFVQLNNTQTSGSYVSKIFDAGNLAEWNSISWATQDMGEITSGQNLILLMHLNETSGTIQDSSGNNHNGSYNGNLYAQDGQIKEALGFDGTDDIVSIPNNSELDIGTGDFTIQMWVKREKTGTEAIISKGYFDGEGFSLFFTSADKIRMRAQNDSINTNASAGASITPSDGWTNIAIVGDRDGSIYFYKNGVLTHSEDISGADGVNIASNKSLTIGQIERAGAGSPQYYYFKGSVDEVLFYKRALSASEIKDNYERGALKFDVFARSCDDISCNGESWTDIGDDSPQNLSLSKNRYFQYRFDFISDTAGYSPKLSSVSVDYDANAISVTFPQQYFIAQRDTATNKGTIHIEGTYTGNPTAIEARFNNGNWKVIDSSPNGGVFSADLTDQNIGQGTLEVRFADNHSINDNVQNVGIGDVYAIAGQSNAEGRGINAQQLDNSLSIKATVYREDNQWRLANDPVDTGTTSGSPWPLLANQIIKNTNIPVAFISAATGGSSITQWQKGGSYYNNLIQQINEATHGTNKIRAVLFFQGERDMSTTGTGCHGDYNCYKNNLSQLAKDLMHDIHAKIVVGQTNFQPNNSTRESVDNIRKAQKDLWDLDENVLSGPSTYDLPLGSDTLHFKTDEQLARLAERWWVSLRYHFYNGSYGRGPRLQKAEWDADNNKLILTFDGVNLLASSGTQGYRIVDGGTILTDSNITDFLVNGHKITLTLNTSISTNAKISIGSYNDGLNKNIPKFDDDFNLGAEAVFSHEIIEADKTAPSITNTIPANNASLASGTTSYTLQLTTDEIAVCRYSANNVDWNNMTEMSNTNSTTHSQTITGLQNGHSYDYYFICEDNSGNRMNSNYHLVFQIKKEEKTNEEAPQINPFKITRTVKTSNQQKTYSMKFTNYVAIRKTILTLTSTSKKPRITVEWLKSSQAKKEIPKLIDAPVYHYEKITSNLPDAEIKRATIRFRVRKSWAEENKAQPEDIVLKRFKDNEWQDLETKFIEEKDGYYYFEAKTPGFSYFAIGIKKKEQEKEEPTKEEEKKILTENIEEKKDSKIEKKKEDKSKENNLFIYLELSLFIILAGFIVFKMQKREKEQKTYHYKKHRKFKFKK